VNGAGKTSVLDAMALLAAAAGGGLGARLAQYGGLAETLTRDRAERLQINVTTTFAGESPIKYELALEPKGQGYWVHSECLSQERARPEPFKYLDSQNGHERYFDVEKKALVPLPVEVSTREALLSRIPRMFPDAERVRSALASTTFYGALDVSARSPVRLPQPMQPADLPGPRGEDLVSALYWLRESDEDRFEMVQDSLRAGFPDFERLNFPPAAAGVLSMTWKDRNFSKPLYMHQLSEGTLRFLWLATLLQSRALGSVTLLDEPEISFHPELQGLLTDLMREAAKRTRLIVTTQSDRLVRFLQPEELLVLDTEKGIAKLTPADQLDIADWLADYSLDELWLTGRLGGRS
jgi:predicted ATPase